MKSLFTVDARDVVCDTVDPVVDIEPEHKDEIFEPSSNKEHAEKESCEGGSAQNLKEKGSKVSYVHDKTSISGSEYTLGKQKDIKCISDKEENIHEILEHTNIDQERRSRKRKPNEYDPKLCSFSCLHA